MRSIGYNSQRDNKDFAGSFKAYWQCFSTAAWMLMSHYTLRIKADDDSGLAEYLDDVEWTIGKKGTAEKTIARLKLKITGGSSYWWVIQKAGIDLWLNDAAVVGGCVFYDGTFPIEDLPEQLKKGPIIMATSKIGGLPGGHIILVVDYNPLNNTLVCNDPFGDATTKYKDPNGEAVEYELDWIQPYITIQKGKCRCMYFVKK